MASAQNTEIVTEATQRTIGYDQSWSEATNTSDPESGIEIVDLNHVDGGSVSFVFATPPLNQAGARDAVLEGLKSDSADYTVIDSGQYDNTAYELAHFSNGDAKLGVFAIVTSDATSTTIVMAVGPVETFKDVIGRIHGGVRLDGVQALRGVDGDGLQTQLQVTDATSVTTSGEDPLAGEDASDTDTSGGTTAGSGGEYTDDIHGYTVTYSGTWDPGNQDVGDFDLISAEPLTLVSFSGLENSGYSGADFELLLTDSFIETLGADGELVSTFSDSQSAVFVGTSGDYLLVQQIIAVSPTEAVIVTAVSSGAGSPDAVYAMLREISVSGTPLMGPVG